jgi:hypothetical protein
MVVDMQKISDSLVTERESAMAFRFPIRCFLLSGDERRTDGRRKVHIMGYGLPRYGGYGLVRRLWAGRKVMG